MRPGAVGYLGVTAGVTADGRTIAIVRFEDEASAARTPERPEQTTWFEGMAKLYDGEPTFTESSDVTEWMGGGSNDAGFVQVMKSTGVDRAQVEKMDAAFEPFTEQRPDLLGGLRIWTGPDSCFDVAYFTTEEEARKGEQAEIPEEMKELMSEFDERWARPSTSTSPTRSSADHRILALTHGRRARVLRRRAPPSQRALPRRDRCAVPRPRARHRLRNGPDHA